MRIGSRFLIALLLFALAARADEIRLKDGSKIIGTIVGFEDGSFKVQTSYGFAMVRKDQIAEIIPTPPKPQPPKPKQSTSAPKDKDSAPDAPNTSAATPDNTAPSGDATSATSGALSPAPSDGLLSPDSPPGAAPASAPDASDEPPASAPPVRSATAKSAARAAAAARRASAPPAAPVGAPASVAEPTAAAPAPTPTPAAIDDAAPQPMREEVVGNLYINRTYGFDIFKPPDWEMLPEERHALPNAVAAMGTDDDTTLLLVGREARKGALDAQAAATDDELHNVYDNFRLISTSHTSVAGEPAIERHFRGMAADRDWSVTVVSVAHGDNLFTVLGMTYADSDLIQIQENVIARSISSLRFDLP
jgi:hypothetical protein